MSTLDLPKIGEPTAEGFITIKITENWIVAIAPQMYNDRVLLMRHNEWRTGWTAGYCYDKGAPAGLAALAWDPETQRHPAGWKKVAGDGRDGYKMLCSFCDSRPTFEDRDEAETTAVWHVYEKHRDIWNTVIGDRPPRPDERPEGL